MTSVLLPPAVVRPAGRADLPAVERHMRGMLADELGGYDPRLHADVDDLAGHYLDRPDRVLLVGSLDDGRVAGTASVRPGGPDPGHVPGWLAARYASGTAQICRVWVAPAARRRGVGGALASAAARWAFDVGYQRVCLHTNASVPGALDFWRAFPGLVEVYDARPDPWSTVHFELVEH